MSDMPEINPHGPELVYVVIANHIAAQITSGRLPVDARLPSEIAMAAEYGVARMTISRAVRELRERGLVRTVVGKGTYVSAKPTGDGPAEKG
ncbi:GntR family transcriptional regulator [Streptomyces sp. NPDC001978]|uniref:GntR family transcriptional regulator n=1 Tax=Streptomyces sp. NPDC001978 TaxID=3364627 RepID=UPI0036C8F9F7